MVIEPQTRIRLLKSPLEVGDPNQIDFPSVRAQTAYFLNQPAYEIEDFTYQRKDNIIRMRGNFDDLINYNYVMYQNDEFSDKWFYAFITKLEFINPETTYIYIKTDVFQTWQFDLQYKACFVEREHVSDDTPGRHTLPEGLDLGEPVINRSDLGDYNVIGSNSLYSYVKIAFQVTELIGNISIPDPSQSGASNRIYNGLFSGLYFFAASTTGDADKIIAAYAKAGKANAIVSIFMIPNQLASGITREVTAEGETFTINWVVNNDAAITMSSQPITKPTTVGEANNPYVPRNKKLLTYPYSYLYASNYSGQQTVYHWEDWENSSQAQFKMYGSISQGCSIRLIPQNFKYGNNEDDAASYGLTGGKLPILAWATDYYTNWLTQNAANIGVSTISNAVGGVTSALTGNFSGAISSITNVLGTMAEVQKAEIIPNTANGQVNCGDINVGTRMIGFCLTCMSIRKEYAERIDHFFDMFGYKVATVKVPNIRTRSQWNFVKTIDCYLEADIPQDDLNEIKAKFNQGLRIWHNPVTFMNYNLPNPVI